MKLNLISQSIVRATLILTLAGVTAIAQTPTGKQVEDLILKPGALQEFTQPLLKVLTPDEKNRLGKFSIAFAEDSNQPASPCIKTRTVRLAYSEHTNGSNAVYLCRNGIGVMSDFMIVAGIYPTVLERISSGMLQTPGPPPTAYARLLLSTELKSQKANGGMVKFPLSYCDPFSFLRLYLLDSNGLDHNKLDPFKIDPTEVDCSHSDPAVDRAEVLKVGQASQLIKRGAEIGKTLGSNDDDDVVSSQVASYVVASIFHLVAHEMAHALCSDTGNACNESNIDGLAISLMLRANGDSVNSIFILTALQNVLLFSAIFNDSEPIHEQSVETMMTSQEFAKRSGQAACTTTSALDDFVKNHPDVMAKIEAAAKTDPMMRAVTENQFAGFRAYLSLQCAVAAK